MISRRSKEITRTSKVLDRIAAGIYLRSRVFNPTADVTTFPFDVIEVPSAAQVTTLDGLEVPADMLKIPSNCVAIPAAAIVLQDDVLVMRSSVLDSPSASRGVTLDLPIRSATALSRTADAMNRTHDVLERSFDVQGIPADVIKVRFDGAETPADFTHRPADILTIPTAILATASGRGRRRSPAG